MSLRTSDRDEATARVDELEGRVVEEPKPAADEKRIAQALQVIESERGKGGWTAYVYLIGDDTHIKIGNTSDVPQRMTQLQTASPTTLKIWRAFPGSPFLESVLQQIFAPYLIRGEWFRLDYTLKIFIERSAQFCICELMKWGRGQERDIAFADCPKQDK